jgi:hypothetical protein
MKRRTALAITRTLAIYGFAGWVYIALVALVHPYTLSLQLTHFAKYLHEDTFGESCFAVSFVSFSRTICCAPRKREKRAKRPGYPAAATLLLTGHPLELCLRPEPGAS